MKKYVFCTLLIWSGFVQALSGVSVGLGRGDEGITAVRLGLVWDWDWRHAATKNTEFTGLWEASLAHWHGNGDITLGAFSPVFRWQGMGSGSVPYLQAGIGAALLSKTRIGRRKLSTAFQFEDRLGVGTKWGVNKEYDLSLNAFHFSNGSIKRPNTGVNLVQLLFLYRF